MKTTQIKTLLILLLISIVLNTNIQRHTNHLKTHLDPVHIPSIVLQLPMNRLEKFQEFQKLFSATHWKNQRALLSEIKKLPISETDSFKVNTQDGKTFTAQDFAVKIARDFCYGTFDLTKDILDFAYLKAHDIKLDNCEDESSKLKLFNMGNVKQLLASETFQKQFQAQVIGSGVKATFYDIVYDLLQYVEIKRVQKTIKTLLVPKSDTAIENLQKNDLLKIQYLVGGFYKLDGKGALGNFFCSGIIKPDQKIGDHIRVATAKHCFLDDENLELNNFVFKLQKNSKAEFEVENFYDRGSNEAISLDKIKLAYNKGWHNVDLHSDYLEVDIVNDNKNKDLLQILNPGIVDKNKIIKLNGYDNNNKDAKAVYNNFVFGIFAENIKKPKAILIPDIDINLANSISLDKQVEMKRYADKYTEFPEHEKNKLNNQINQHKKYLKNLGKIEMDKHLDNLSELKDLQKAIDADPIQSIKSFDDSIKALDYQKASYIAYNNQHKVIETRETQKYIDSLNAVKQTIPNIDKYKPVHLGIEDKIAKAQQEKIKFHENLSVGGVSGSVVLECELTIKTTNCNIIGSVKGIKKLRVISILLERLI